MKQQTSLTDDLQELADKLTHIEFYSNAEDITTTDSMASKRALFRTTLTKSVSGSNLTCEYAIPTSDFCPSSTIASVTSSSQITLVSAASFAVGDRIQIRQEGNYKDRTILTKSTNTITFEALPYTPSTGVTVAIKATQKALIKDGTSTLKSGTLDTIRPCNFYKTTGTERTGKIVINLGAT